MSIITDTYYENKSVKKHIYMYYKKCYRTNNCMQIEEIKYDITTIKIYNNISRNRNYNRGSQ